MGTEGVLMNEATLAQIQTRLERVERQNRVLIALLCGVADLVLLGAMDPVPDLSPKFHPEMKRVRSSFEAVWLGGAAGRGAEPRASSSAPSRCVTGAASLA